VSRRHGVAGPSDGHDAHLARAAALREAAHFGMVGLLSTGAGGDPDAPDAPWGRDSVGSGAVAARGAMWGPGQGAGRFAPGLGLGRSAAGVAARGAGVGAQAPSPTQGTPPATPPADSHAPIDPNGRFATTYRPGRGHLAAFEHAVARGVIPAADRALVSDIGAGWAPDLAPAENRALALQARLERAALAPSGGPVHLRLALRSTPKSPAGRPHLSVHLVLDVSGSMQGDSIVRAKESAHRLVDRLAPSDDLSIVAFSSSASVLVADGPVAGVKAGAHRAIGELRADGGTNIGEGLRLGYEQAASRGIAADAVKVVFLVSDGKTNTGITNNESLSRMALGAFQEGVQTSTFGLGLDYDAELMSGVAADGAGGYYYLRDADEIAPALSTELDRRLDPVATAVELRIRWKGDVKVLRAYGSHRLGEQESARVRAAEVAADSQAEKRYRIRRDRHEDVQGGMRFFLPAFARDDRHAMLFEVNVPSGAEKRNVAVVELKYKDRISGSNVIEESPIAVSYAKSDAESAASTDASVARTVQGFLAGDSLLEASRRLARGDSASALALLAEREAILRQASRSLAEPALLAECSRLERLRSRAAGQAGPLQPPVLAMILETAGRAYLR
jgi:Mg-chelatase subunit ChlD